MFVDDLLVGLDGVLERPLLVGADVATVVAALRLVVAVHVQLRAAMRALEARPKKRTLMSVLSLHHKPLIRNVSVYRIKSLIK